jgi:hypothetical protein
MKVSSKLRNAGAMVRVQAVVMVAKHMRVIAVAVIVGYIRRIRCGKYDLHSPAFNVAHLSVA